MSLNVSREKIYKDCANTEFWKGGIQSPFLVRETYRTGKSKYFLFYKGHDHNTNDCIQLKDNIEGFIKRGRMTEYVKRGKIYREESPKGKFPSNTVDVGTNGERKEVNKVKRS